MSRLDFEIRDFSPVHTFECGQCFRWNREADGSYSGIASGRLVNLEFIPSPEDSLAGTLRLHNATEDDRAFWTDYFDLDTDYGAIKADLGRRDPILAKAVAFGGGMRILRQEPWETLVSFILSANNNIPRIRQCIESLADNFGTPAGAYRGKARHSLPSPEVLAALTPEDLAVCRMGYRAPYLVGAAREISLRGIGEMEGCLGELPGVGPKVAGCIRLFSLACHQAFPIDVWVRRTMSRLYGFDEKDSKGMAAFALENFGEKAGIAQQYLFYYTRSGGGLDEPRPEPSGNEKEPGPSC